MANVIGEATITVGADTTGFAQSLTSKVGTAAKSAGSKFVGVLGGVVKAGALTTGAAAAGLLGTALAKGFTRLKSIDDARGKLAGLGHTAKAVDGIMDDALASVKGTAFGLGDAAAQAANLVASGIEPGKDLQRTLKLLADTATITGSSLEDMGGTFQQAAANGQVTGAVIGSLQDRGVPAIKFLADQTNTSMKAVSEQLGKGGYSFEVFQQAMEKGLGGAALESGRTFTGALANVQAAMGRFGAALLGPIFAKLPGVFENLIVMVDKLGPVGEKVGGTIGTVFNKAYQIISKFIGSPFFKGLVTNVFEAIKSVAETVWGVIHRGITIHPRIVKRLVHIKYHKGEQKALGKLGDMVKGAFERIRELVKSAMGKIGPIVTAVISTLAPLIRRGVKAIPGIIEKIGDAFKTLADNPHVKNLVNSIGDFARSLINAGKKAVPAVKDIAEALLPLLKGIAKGAAGAVILTLTGAFKALKPVVSTVGNLIGKIGDFAKNHGTAFRRLAGGILIAVAAFKAYKAIQKAVAAFQAGYATAMAGSTLALKGQTAATKAGMIAGKLKLAFEKTVKAFTVIWTGIQWLFNAAMSANPLGLAIIALAAIAAALVIAYKKSETFRNIVETALNAVKSAFGWLWDKIKEGFNWLKDNWPLVLAILTGPIGLAVLAIVKNWDKIKAATKAAWEWVKDKIGAFVDWLKSVPGRIWGFLKNMWTKVKTVARTSYEWIKDKISDWLNFIKSIPGRVWNFLKGIWDRLVEAGDDAERWIREQFTKVINFMKSLPGRIWQGLKNIWDKFKTATATVKEWVIEKFNALVGWFKKLPGRLANVGKGMFDFIKDSVTGALSWIIEQFNKLDLSINIDRNLPGPLPDIHVHTGDLIPDLPNPFARAAGGPVKQGYNYLVGEKGPELFIPYSSGMVIPNAGKGRAEPTRRDVPGSTDELVAEAMGALIEDAKERKVERQEARKEARQEAKEREKARREKQDEKRERDRKTRPTHVTNNFKVQATSVDDLLRQATRISRHKAVGGVTTQGAVREAKVTDQLGSVF